MAQVPLSAAQRSKIRRLSAPKEMSPDEEGGELNIVPFLDIIMNVLMFVLATVTVTFTATLDTFPPKAGGAGARPPTTPTLGLTILVVSDGFSVKARGGNVSPGCRDTGPGLAVAKTNADYDYAGLKKCVQGLKGASPDFAEESQVIISANANVPYQVIISVMDAVRDAPNPNDPEKPIELFPDVQFGVAK